MNWGKIKKPFMVTFVFMALALLIVIFLSFSDTPVEFPFPDNVMRVVYGVYAVVMVLFLFLSFGNRFTFFTAVSAVFQMVAVYCLVQAVLIPHSEGGSMYMPIALILSLLGSIFSSTEVRRARLKKKREEMEEKKRKREERQRELEEEERNR